MNHLSNLRSVIKDFFAGFSDEIFVVAVSDYDHQETIGIFDFFEEAALFLVEEGLIPSAGSLSYNSQTREWYGSKYVISCRTPEHLGYLNLPLHREFRSRSKKDNK